MWTASQQACSFSFSTALFFVVAGVEVDTMSMIHESFAVLLPLLLSMQCASCLCGEMRILCVVRGVPYVHGQSTLLSGVGQKRSAPLNREFEQL